MAAVPEPLAPTDILTPTELAERLKVKPGWIYEQMRPWRKNPLPVMRAGRLLRFSWVAVCDWLRREQTILTAKAPTKRPVVFGKRRVQARKAVGR